MSSPKIQIAEKVPSLDSLRAIAALTVLVGHIELIKKWQSLPNIRDSIPLFSYGGQLGVVLFFVISGYIITTLLLREKDTHGDVKMKAFYMRRIFRIWPLYYLVLFVSMFIFSYTPDTVTAILCFSVLANVSKALGMGWVANPPVWSIGVEEQFYLFWPWIFKFLKRKSTILWLISLFIVGYSLLPHVLLFVLLRTGFNPGDLACSFVEDFFGGARYNCMAMGGLLALLQKMYPMQWLRRKVVAYVLIFLPVFFIIIGTKLRYFNGEFWGVLFTLLLASATVNKFYLLNNKILDYIGSISFGVYMYHWMIIVLIVPFFSSLLQHNIFLGNLALYGSVMASTLIVSAVSFHYFERYFLRIRDRYKR